MGQSGGGAGPEVELGGRWEWGGGPGSRVPSHQDGRLMKGRRDGASGGGVADCWQSDEEVERERGRCE